VVLHQRVGRATWWAVAMATLGLGFLSLQGWAIGFGEALTLLGAVVYAVHLVLLGRWSVAEHAYGLTVVQLGTVAVMCTLLTAADGGPARPPDAATWAAIVFLAVFATALAFGIQTWAQSQLTPTRTAVIMTTEPVWAGVTGVLVAGDRVTARFLVGAALVLAAMYLVELAPRRGPSGTGAVAPLPHLEP
jgi:drug/metabolite transporter (DMT)-like permease